MSNRKSTASGILALYGESQLLCIFYYGRLNKSLCEATFGRLMAKMNLLIKSHFVKNQQSNVERNPFKNETKSILTIIFYKSAHPRYNTSGHIVTPVGLIRRNGTILSSTALIRLRDGNMATPQHNCTETELDWLYKQSLPVSQLTCVCWWKSEHYLSLKFARSALQTRDEPFHRSNDYFVTEWLNFKSITENPRTFEP